jgi:hypothetical protein
MTLILGRSGASLQRVRPLEIGYDLRPPAIRLKTPEKMAFFAFIRLMTPAHTTYDPRHYDL